MFGRRKQPTQQIETLIAAGTRIEGNLIATAGVHLEGCVHGDVTSGTGGSAVLTIAPNATVEGSIEAPHVIVHGEVRGDIRATGKVELGATARVSGNVSYGMIEVVAGAQIEGRLVAAAGAEVADTHDIPRRPMGA